MMKDITASEQEQLCVILKKDALKNLVEGPVKIIYIKTCE